MLRKIRSSRAFTLVELMIVVAIIGLLAALAIYGVRRYMTNSKTAEARQALGAISKGARAAFDGEVWADTGVIAAGSSKGGAGGQLCPDAAAVPASIDDVSGKKYQSQDSDWDADGGWSCLRFSMSGPQYFQYEYKLDGTTKFDATAKSKLGGEDDDTLSLSLAGEVQGSTVTIAPTIKEELVPAT